LLPIASPTLFDLDDLLGVDEALRDLERNTRQFLAKLPYNNVLLHGGRGTGKSSAVRGLLARYGDHGLRVVEVDRSHLGDLPRILASLGSGREYHFLLFCDDLSFGPGESGHRELKAALEGGLVGRPDNLCIVATSNRRHLLPETMDENRASRLDSEGQLQLAESLEEKLALADRFGLVIGFYSIDQAGYLEIVRHDLSRAGIQDFDEELAGEALRWALARGSRSGRSARQFVDDVIGRRGLEEHRGDPPT